nr:hypothetical protein [Bacillus sp. FJAT-49736]
MVKPNGYGIKDPHQEDVCEGIDACGDEVVSGDYILEYDGEIILVENAAKFLIEHCGAIIKVAGEE